MTDSAVAPHIATPSPLDHLAARAIRQYGDMAIETVDGDLILMFIDFANRIVEDIRAHPYWPSDELLPYYVSQTDARNIPDPIVIAGLKAFYAEQQMSEKMSIYMPQYLRLMNMILYQRRYGNGQQVMTPIENSQCIPYARDE